MQPAHFVLFLTPGGYHEAGWRAAPPDPADPTGVRSLRRSTATAERGRLDAVFLADRLAYAPIRARAFPQAQLDPLSALCALAPDSDRIGLIGTASTSFNAPWDLARRLSSADHLSAGRIGWNVVTTYDAAAAPNFGLAPLPAHDDRYARAGEFVDVVRRLWDAWADDAVPADAAAGVWALPERIDAVDFHGAHYDVGGPLNLPRSPQGHPVLAQAGSSPAGVDLAGRVADLVFTPQASIEAGIAFRERLGAAAAGHGRSIEQVRVLPGLAFVLAGTEAEAAAQRRELEASVDPEFRWRNLARTAGLDAARIDPTRPLAPELAAEAPQTTFAQHVVSRARETGLPFVELAATVTGLPGGLEFTGTPEGLATLIADWVSAGASDGFTLQPARVPADLDAFVDEVVPLLRRRGLARSEYAGSTLREHLGLARPSARP